MNEKGEITLLGSIIVLTLSSLILLCSLELQKSFNLLQKRTHLFLCAKETKGEVHHFMKFMGRTNWAIKNINRLSLVMVFIPGLQGAAMNAQKAKKYLQYIQEGTVVSYLKTLNDLRIKECPLDPRMLITPFVLGSRVLERDTDGAAILRKTKWNYYFLSKPYFLDMKINAKNWEGISPDIKYQTDEKLAKLSSLFSSR